MIRNLAIYADMQLRDSPTSNPNENKGGNNKKRSELRGHFACTVSPVGPAPATLPTIDRTIPSPPHSNHSQISSPRTDTSAVALELTPIPGHQYPYRPPNSSNSSGQTSYRSPSAPADITRLPMDIKVVIPLTLDDIRQVIHDFIDGASFCRLCFLSNNAPPAKELYNSSECQVLPDGPVLRYEMFAYRLANIHKFERMLKEGSQESICMLKGIIGPQLEGLRQDVSNQLGSLPPLILRPLSGNAKN